ncbi:MULTISPECIES: hypothetical protein [unclassified Streptomyces]|uniref:hypothetical protein n=1 Tax=unclassified Streptomyces TaxID=2593676 RepID=UPI002365785A|nr:MULTISPECIES: hypothetical protein [unclassified Streptomyces]MDF3141058.1 hypothetical protein [Streptomyces sp. T21Q-yed]WDF45043.1 hypothetical protein PBV52_50995 [Streptomyces sp. T12]
MICDAVTCDRRACNALMLEPVDDPYELNCPEFADYVSASGWTYSAEGHTCPACVAGKGPVRERGECDQCGGRTRVRHGRNQCMYCHKVQPDSGDDW